MRRRNWSPFGGTCGVRVAHLFSFLCCLIICIYVPSFVLWCPLRFPHKNDVQTSVRLYPQLFVGGLKSCLRYLCFVFCVLFVYSGVQHILCCVFLRLVYRVLPFSLDCPFLLIVPLVFSNGYLQLIKVRKKTKRIFKLCLTSYLLKSFHHISCHLFVYSQTCFKGHLYITNHCL